MVSILLAFDFTFAADLDPNRPYPRVCNKKKNLSLSEFETAANHPSPIQLDFPSFFMLAQTWALVELVALLTVQ